MITTRYRHQLPASAASRDVLVRHPGQDSGPVTTGTADPDALLTVDLAAGQRYVLRWTTADDELREETVLATDAALETGDVAATEQTLERLVGRTENLYDREAKHQRALDQGRAYSAPAGRTDITLTKALAALAPDQPNRVAVFLNPKDSGVQAVNQLVRQSATSPYLLRAWRIADITAIKPKPGAKPVTPFNRGGGTRAARCEIWAPAGLTITSTNLALTREEDFAAGMQEIDPRGVVVLPGRGTLYQMTATASEARGGIDYHWDEWDL